MPKVDTDTPQALKPFKFHGVELVQSSKDEWRGDCFVCGKPKMYVNASSSGWHCFSCGEEGNNYTFLRRLHELSEEAFDGEGLEEFAADRTLLSPTTLLEFGVCRSFLSGEWIVPAYAPDGKLSQLYKYSRNPEGKRIMYATAGMPARIFGMGNYAADKPETWWTEGMWKVAVLTEVLARCKMENGVLVPCDDPDESMLANINVLGVPGCQTFDEHWAQLSAGKSTTILYDSDHPRRNPQTGNPVEPAGFSGVKRAVKTLAAAAEPPLEINYLNWGADGFDPTLETGYDVRDWLAESDTVEGRVELLGRIMDRIAPAPLEWTEAIAKHHNTGVALSPLPCESWAELTEAAKNKYVLKWTHGVDKAFKVMLAVIASTGSPGDQLWCQVLSPPSTAKSILCDAIRTSKKWVKELSSMTSYYSGYKMQGSKDCSLISQLMNMTMVTKDGDTLVHGTGMNRDKILAQERDLYDGRSSTSFGNDMGQEYEGIRMTRILCGTNALRVLDKTEMGARYVRVFIVKDMDDDLEEEIGMMAAVRAKRNMSCESNGKPESHDTPEMTNFKRLTAGFIDYLRRNAHRLSEAVEMTDDQLREVVKYAKFTAIMRARPSEKQNEKVEREMCARLSSQYTRLGTCLAVVLGKSRVDDEVMATLREVTLDTSDGRAMHIAHQLLLPNDDGTIGKTCNYLARINNQKEDDEKRMLRFMCSIKAAENFRIRGEALNRYRLTERFAKLYKLVIGE